VTETFGVLFKNRSRIEPANTSHEAALPQHSGHALKKHKSPRGATVGAALCGRPSGKTRTFTPETGGHGGPPLQLRP